MENRSTIHSQISQQSQAASVEQNTSPKQKIHVLFPVLITFVISAIVFGFGGYYYGISIKETSNVKTGPISTTDFSSDAPTPSSTLSPNPLGIETLQYVHPENMYELKYPSNFVIKENRLGEKSNSACKTELILAGSEDELNEEYQGTIVVDVCRTAEELFPDSQFSNIDGPEPTQVNLGGSIAYVKSGELDAFKLGSTFQVKRVTSYKDGYAYTLDLRYKPNSPDYSSEFDQIVSSFVIQN